MNKNKLTLLAIVMLGIALASLMVTVPAMAQNGAQNGETLQTQNQQQLQTQDCKESGKCNGAAVGKILRPQERLQTQACLNASTCNGASNGTQLQNRARLNECNCAQVTTGNGTEQNTYLHQYRYRHKSP